MTEEAANYWQWAGERAIRRSAHQEAVNHLTKGLEITEKLPETPERIRRELHLQTALGPALIAIKGYGAENVEKAYGRARHLCRLIGDAPELGSVLIGLEAFYLLRAELQTAKDLAEQVLALAQRTLEPRGQPTALGAVGLVLGGGVTHGLFRLTAWSSGTRPRGGPSPPRAAARCPAAPPW